MTDILNEHVAVHILRVKVCKVVNASGPGRPSEPARDPLLMLFIAAAYSSKT
jgi:hypothetical protein